MTPWVTQLGAPDASQWRCRWRGFGRVAIAAVLGVTALACRSKAQDATPGAGDEDAGLVPRMAPATTCTLVGCGPAFGLEERLDETWEALQGSVLTICHEPLCIRGYLPVWAREPVGSNGMDFEFEQPPGPKEGRARATAFVRAHGFNLEVRWEVPERRAVRLGDQIRVELRDGSGGVLGSWDRRVFDVTQSPPPNGPGCPPPFCRRIHHSAVQHPRGAVEPK